MCQGGDVTATETGKDGKMVKDTMIGVDLAKNAFQLHGASTIGHVKFRKKTDAGALPAVHG
jgi:hypothetical protein